MMKIHYPILLLSIIFLLSCSPGLKSSTQNTANNESQNNNPGDEQTNNPSNPAETPIDNTGDIRETYRFLKEESFWKKAESMLPIPNTKNCSNTFTYAYFGVARWVYKNLRSNFPILKFSPSPRYAPFFNAYPANTDNEELFFSQYAHDKNESIHLWVQKELKRPLTLTSLTLGSQHDHDRHCRHRAGTSVDVRPFPGDTPTTWRSNNYNRAENLKFIQMLAAREDVNVIFFNDPEILKDEQIAEIKKIRQANGNPLVFQAAAGHDNHIHYEFKLDTEIDKITSHVYQSLIPVTPSTRIDWNLEYSQH